MTIAAPVARFLGIETKLVIRFGIIWLTCAIACGLHAVMLAILAKHGDQGDFTIQSEAGGFLPYVGIALAELLVHRFDLASKILCVGVFLIALPYLYLHLSGLQEMIAVRDAQGTGAEEMACSPTLRMLGILLVYLGAILVISLAWLSAIVDLMWPNVKQKVNK